MHWNDLSLKDKSDLMRLYIKNGIYSLEEMKKDFNESSKKYEIGGHLYVTGGLEGDDADNLPIRANLTRPKSVNKDAKFYGKVVGGNYPQNDNTNYLGLIAPYEEEYNEGQPFTTVGFLEDNGYVNYGDTYYYTGNLHKPNTKYKTDNGYYLGDFNADIDNVMSQRGFLGYWLANRKDVLQKNIDEADKIKKNIWIQQ